MTDPDAHVPGPRRVSYDDLSWMSGPAIRPRNNTFRKLAWGILFILIALWVGYEAAPYLGMFAVTLQEGLK